MLPSGFHFFERGWLSSNTLLLQSADQAAVIDTGYATHAEQLLRLVRQQLQGQSLDLLINTHLHSDHCGGNALLQSHFDQLAVHVPASQFSTVNIWDPQFLTFELTGQTCERFKASQSVFNDQFLTICGLDWLAMASPGHDNDSFMLYQPDHEVLLSADALWENGFGVVFPEFLGGDGFQGIASTLDDIEKRHVKCVLPGHGRAFTDVNQALSLARSKLDYFSKQPDKHALYAAKVLLKFKLMELHQQELGTFLAWARSAPLLHTIHGHFFSQTKIAPWVKALITEMVERKAMRIESGLLINL